MLTAVLRTDRRREVQFMIGLTLAVELHIIAAVLGYQGVLSLPLILPFMLLISTPPGLPLMTVVYFGAAFATSLFFSFQSSDTSVLDFKYHLASALLLSAYCRGMLKLNRRVANITNAIMLTVIGEAAVIICLVKAYSSIVQPNWQ